MTDYRNRIKGLEYVKAADLTAHPGNWRQHLLKDIAAGLWYNMTNQEGQYAISRMQQMREPTLSSEQSDMWQVPETRQQTSLPGRGLHRNDRPGRGHMPKASPLAEKHDICPLPGMRAGISQTHCPRGMRFLLCVYHDNVRLWLRPLSAQVWGARSSLPVHIRAQ